MRKIQFYVCILAICVLAMPLTISHAAPTSPFRGHWQAIDVDGSEIRLTIAGPPSGPFRITWTENYISYCSGEAGIARGTGWLNDGDPNLLEADLHVKCFTTGASLDLHLTFRYHVATNTLSTRYPSGMVVIWHRPGPPQPPPPALSLRVNYGHDWVESFYEAGHFVYLTVTEADGVTVRATAELFTEPKDFWDGEPGFQTVPEDWDPGLPNIQAYDWVYGWVDNGASAQVQIGDIGGTIDLAADSIGGTIIAPWLPQDLEVEVECHPWGAPEPQPEMKYDSILPNGDDTYACSWDPDTEWDIWPGQDVGVGYSGPDGQWVASAFSVPMPSFAAYMPWTIEGYDWPLGDAIGLNINGGEYTATAVSEQRPDSPEGSTRVLFELWQDDFSMETGDHILMIDEAIGVTKELWVANLKVTEISLEDDTVSGIYDPSRSFWIRADDQEPISVEFSGDTWVATFADLVPGTWGFVAQDDEDYDGTVWDFYIPNPHFTIFPDWEWFDGMDWPDGATVTISVDGKPECSLEKESWGSFFNGGFPEGCDVAIGDLVTFDDGTTTREHTVRNLAITNVDMVENTVAGTADPGAMIHVWVHEAEDLLQPTAGEDSTWLADFDDLGLDLQGGTSGRAEIRDEFGNATAVDWAVPVTLIVTSTEDVLADDGLCTLREAIIAANTNTPSGEMDGECPGGLESETDTIVLEADQTYSLTKDSTYEDDALDGDLDVWDNSPALDLVIRVEGGGTATISQDASVDDRVLQNNGDLQIEGLTLTGGGSVEGGGGVQNYGMLTLQSCMISGNTAAHDGGGLLNASIVTIQGGSQITDNSASYSGGGVWNNETGTLVVEGGTISGNSAADGGGGIANAGMLTVDGSAVSDNTATNDGGGLQNRNTGTAVIQNSSQVIGNTASCGGGLWNEGALTVDATTVSGNEITGFGGGGIANFGATTVQNGSVVGGATADEGNTAETGGGIWSLNQLIVDASTISNNTATSNNGGGVDNAGTATIQNGSVIAQNSALNGGGVSNWENSTLIVEASTISGNTARDNGGSIINWSGGVLTVQGSTISGNTAGWNGGGLHNWGTLTVTSSALLGNSSDGEGDAVFSAVDTLNATSVTGSCIVGNGNTAFYNERSVSQSATGNWWGDESGPSGEGPGSGDSVSPNVDFSGWLTEPPPICASD